MPLSKRNDQREREDRFQEESEVWWKGFGLSGGARGRHLTHLVYVTFLAAAIIAEGYAIHQSIMKAIYDHEQSTLYRTKDNQAINLDTQKQVATSLREIRDAQDSMKDEIVYVLIQDEAQRKALNIEMPQSLRERIRRR